MEIKQTCCAHVAALLLTDGIKSESYDCAPPHEPVTVQAAPAAAAAVVVKACDTELVNVYPENM